MTQKQYSRVPRLRFPGFEKTWEYVSLAERVVSIKSGRTKHEASGDVPVYGSTGLIGFAEKAEFEGDNLLIARVGANAGQINRASGSYGVTDNTLVITPSDQIELGFLEASLRLFNLNRLVFGSGQPLITGTMLKRLKRAFPTLPEQKKIAAFLSSVDTKISQIERKKTVLNDYKKSCVQQLFSQKIRFKVDDGSEFPEWEEKKLGEIVILSAGTSKSKFNSDGGDRFIVDMGSVNAAGRFMCSKRTNYEGDLLDVGDLVMPKDDIGGGNIIGKVGLIDKPSTYVLGDHVYRLQVQGQNSVFLTYLINSSSINKSFRRKANGTAQLGLARSSVLEQPVPLPHLDEQRKIADFLSAIDRKIELVATELENAKLLKKGLLQQMFI